MSSRFRFAMPLVLAAAASSALAAGALPIGGAAPSLDVKMQNVDGTDMSIADAKGAKGTLVVFTCNHCPFAKMWESRIVEIGNGAAAMGIGVIAINANDPKANADDGFEAMQARAKDKGFRFPYVVDATSGVARAFGATRTPEVFLLDPEGNLVYHGAVDDNAQDAAKVEKKYLEDALAALAAGQDVAVKETKSIGCTIKFRS